jgi:hypothetical protein
VASAIRGGYLCVGSRLIGDNGRKRRKGGSSKRVARATHAGEISRLSIRLKVAAAIVVLASLGCAANSKHPASPAVQASQDTITHNANGAIVERIGMPKPILSSEGIIVTVYRITHVPGAPYDVFYVPCNVQGGCEAQPIPGARRSVIDQAGDVITISNTAPDTTTMKRWTPPPDEGISKSTPRP